MIGNSTNQKRSPSKLRESPVRWIALVVVLCWIVAIIPDGSRLVARISGILGTGDNVMVIDPGHGGIDGGAESSGGMPEKNINLAISLELGRLAEKAGWKVIFTREDDSGLYDEGTGAIRSLKTQDLKNRKQIIDDVEPALTVSIHLNSFKQDRSVRGAQVFYPPCGQSEAAEKSKLLAESVQENLIRRLRDGSERTAMEKGDTYILKDAKTPIIIVECGFLSNAEEAKRLESSHYQKNLAKYIFEGISRYKQLK